MNQKKSKLIFLCGLGDYHAIDWYRSSLKLLKNKDVLILTDIKQRDGLQDLTNENDKVFHLILLDRFLFHNKSILAHFWRNLLKLLVVPIQVYLLRQFAKQYSEGVFFAHGLYFMFLASMARVHFCGTPQGSEILVRPNKSKIYRIFSYFALKRAAFVTVDSESMQKKMFELYGINPIIVQNGIDISSIEKFIAYNIDSNLKRTHFTSIRGFTSLYRIHDIITSRNKAQNKRFIPLTLIYPFFDIDYRNNVVKEFSNKDIDLGRLDKSEMYKILTESKIVFSIPQSDSSPRSVYEAIFCGSIVIITYNSYYEILPQCMKERIVIADISNENWFLEGILEANKLIEQPFIPDNTALDMFDQERSMQKIVDLLFEQN